MLTIFLVVVLLLILTLGFLQTQTEFYKTVNKFPGPTAYPLIGNLLEILQVSDAVAVFKKLRSKAVQYQYSSHRFWVFKDAHIHIVTPEDIEKILTSNTNITKTWAYDFLHPWLGTGLLTSTGAKWQKRRKILTPAFHFSILRKFCDVMIENSEILVQDLKKECGKEKTNIIPYMTESALKTICETAMGTKLDSSAQHKTYITSIHKMSKVIAYRVMRPWFYSDHIYHSVPPGWNQNSYMKILHNFTLRVIEERENNFKDSDLEDVDNEDVGLKKKRLAMLDLLIKEKRKNNSIDTTGIREEVDTFMFEGHDTTSMAMSFGLMLLANHRNIQDKIVDELKEIFEHTTRKTTMQDLQNMQYLEMVIKETLRIYPSVPVITRKIVEDVQLDDKVIPAGCQTNMHIFDIHHNPKYFPDPEVFDPDRFLLENSKNRHPFAFIPFSAGPRNCIGQKFAMLELKSMYSAILWNYVLEPVHRPEDLEIEFDIVLRNKGPVYVKFTPRIHKNM